MIRIGIIGDIGAGKSYVAKNFGFPVFNADLEVKKIYKKSRKCFNKFKKIFPNYVFSFPLRKKELSQAVLINKNNIKKINKVIHPEVRLRMNKFLIKNKKKKAVVLDVPLLLEGRINKKKDILVFVYAKKKEINKRLKRRKNYNLKIINKLKELQLPLEIKKRRSNFRIYNNFRSIYVKKNIKKIKKEIFKNERNSS